MIAFALRFPASEMAAWAKTYRAEMPEAERVLIAEVAPEARGRGWLTKDEFLSICRWKSPRSQTRCRCNDEAFIRAATTIALVTDNERLRIEVLRLLDGVEWPTASAILHLVHVGRYPLLDRRALWSAGLDAEPRHDFPLWWAYTDFCRQLADESGETMRDVDRALYQFSVKRQAGWGRGTGSHGQAAHGDRARE
jgi:hypothetical protein